MMLLKDLRKTHTSLWSYLLIRAILIAAAAVIVYPFYNCLVMSVLPYEYSSTLGFYLIPPKLEFANYQVLLSSASFQRGFGVTIRITLFGTLYNLFLTITMAYALSRKGYYGRTFFINLVVVTMFFSGGLVPNYLLIRNLGLLDTLASMIIPMGILPFYLILMKTYFGSLPDEIHESAEMDGANDLLILTKVVLPCAMPIIATVTLFYAVMRWNEWFNGMIYIRTADHLKPLQLYLREMLASMDSKRLNQDTLNQLGKQRIYTQSMQMAIVMLTTLPILCVYPFLQRFFVKGIMIGSIKG